MTNATEKRNPIPEPPAADTPQPTNPSTVRRRLMLGVTAALPSVYTLTSGAQMAVASNLRCWDGRDRDVAHDGNAFAPPAEGAAQDVHPYNGGGDGSGTQRFTLDNDHWLRKQVYYGKSRGRPAFCVMTDQADCRSPTDPQQAADGSVWIVDGQRVIAGQASAVTHLSSSPQAYGLVYVDQQGTIALLDPDAAQQQPLRPVTEVCWNSMLGGRTSDLG